MVRRRRRAAGGDHRLGPRRLAALVGDVRWLLARERTRLSRMRFSLGFSLTAIALAVLVPPQVPTLLVVVPGVLCALAGLVAALASFRS
ncbi:DUF202 domain-containing protein [Actinomycetospora soli]|uniref:DUF202 domain-containing protein n=1 Tax=Actinomycetospora soli TaxID=2893887 RepID=UPI0027E2642D|nr:DUF202 domain-containing protein [Actinomycetospora soli]